MKKVVAYLCIILGLGVMVTSVSNALVMKIWKWDKEHLMNGKWYGKHNSKWGDLTRRAYLDNIPKFREPNSYAFDTVGDTAGRTLGLHLIGDSFTEDIPGEAFKNVNEYHYSPNTRLFNGKPDASKKNVLIIEITERFIIGMMHNGDFFDTTKKDRVPTGGDGKKSYSAMMNKNLEYVMLDYNFINKFKCLKAEYSYKMFSRVSGDVVISDDKDLLFFKPTVAPKGIFSSYAPRHDSEISFLVAKLNSIYDQYRRKGFSEIYLALVPSPATILQPEGYNMLIPYIQTSPALKMPVVDVYTSFKAYDNPKSLYRVGDTHWNNNGMHIWLNLVNERLRKHQ